MSEWACQQCTFLNSNHLQQCEICAYKRSSQPIPHSIESDLAFAKQLQQQYNQKIPETVSDGIKSLDLTPSPKKPSPKKTPPYLVYLREQMRCNNNSNSNNSNANNNNSNNNHSVSNSTVSSVTQNRNSRKRKIGMLDPIDIEEDVDSDDLEFMNNIMDEQNRPQKFKIIEQNIEYKSHVTEVDTDIIRKLGEDFVPGWNAKFSNPVHNDKMAVTMPAYVSHCAISSDITGLFNGRHGSNNIRVQIKCDGPNMYPYFTIDFKHLQIKLNAYRILHPIYYRHNEDGRWITCGNTGFLEGWSVEASNDLINWKMIHSTDDYGRFGISLMNASNTSYVGQQGKHGWNINDIFYTKFRFRMTRPNSSGEQILKLKSFKLYGQIKRRIENKPHIDEHDPIAYFPNISTNKCLGDMNNAFKILNEYENLQHNECKEYIDNIPHLKVQLKDYQRRGLQWMLNMENNGNIDGIHGGLVCDEMGLGKTVQMIALMLVQKQKSTRKDRSLIITPLSLIDQWINEIMKIAGPNTFKYINYYGTQRKKLSKKQFEECDIVFSTTQTFSNAMGKIEKVYDHWTGEWWSRSHKQELLFKLPNNFFRRIIIDESHEIKNTQSGRSKAICTFALRCQSRWCLTGTPIKNNIVADLAGMIRFLGYKHSEYSDSLKLTMLEKVEKLKVSSTMNKQRCQNFWLDLNHKYCTNKIKNLLSKLMIRRTKKQVFNNDFVEKEEIIVKCKLNEEERIIYDKNANEALEQYKQFKTEKSVMGRYFYLLRMLTKLRQICDHCSLVFNRINENNHESEINTSNIMDLEANIDILARVEEIVIKRLNEMESLLAYECPICYELSELNGVMLSQCGHLFCKECISDILSEQLQQRNDSNVCPMCRTRFTQRNVLKITHILQSEKLDNKHSQEYEEYKKEYAEICKSNNNNNKRFEKYNELVRKHSTETFMSSKIMELIKRIKYIFENHPGDKILVFSNFTQMFKIICNKLNGEKINNLQFHGSMNRKQRKVILDKFISTTLNYNVLLISAKCASVGLNLMCANHVIFLDPRYNVALDMQAIGRCWRIGQNKKVYVTRMIFENTVEETIYKLQQHKQNNEQESNLGNLKQKSKLTEKHFDIIFDYQNDNNDNSDNNDNRNNQND